MVKKDIVKKIKNMRGSYEISEFFKNEVPEEFIFDEGFMEELRQENPIVEEAVAIYFNDRSAEMISGEIEEKGLKAVIEEDFHRLAVIPRDRKQELYELAKEYEEDKQYEKAKQVYDRIVKFGKDGLNRFYERFSGSIDDAEEKRRQSIYYNSKFSYYVCKLKNGEELTPEDEREIESLVAEDKDKIIEPIKPIDFMKSFFKDVELEELEESILPIGEGDGTNGTRTPNPDKIPKAPSKYPKGLSPTKRLQYIKDNFKITRVMVGQEKLAGFSIIETEKTPDVIIVEKFFKQGKDGRKLEESNSVATYFIHNDANIDLTKITLGELYEKQETQKKGEPKLIHRIYHRGEETYYTRFEKTCLAMQNKELIYTADEEKESVEEMKDYIAMLEEEITELREQEKSLRIQIKSVKKELEDEEKRCDLDIDKIDSEEMEKAVTVRIEELEVYKEIIQELQEKLDEVKAKEKENGKERKKYKLKLNAQLDRGEE